MKKPKVVFEDEDILVLDKPAGIVVDRAATVKEKTIQDWIEKRKVQRYKGTKVQRDSDFIGRSGIVHRLDKETSGLLLVAKTPAAFKNLQRQFKKRQVEKKYIALVHGRVGPKEGVIQALISRSPFDRKKFGVFLGGREAKTRYRVIAVKDGGGKWEASRGWEVWVRKNFPTLLIPTSRPVSHFSPSLLTLLEVMPTTGRTHQIRVHLKHIGHPVVSDKKYAGRKRARVDRQRCSRQFLHASYLAFTHPRSGKRVEFVNPLPKELKEVLREV